MSQPLNTIRNIALGSATQKSLTTKRIIRQILIFFAYFFIGMLGIFILIRSFPGNPYMFPIGEGGFRSDAQQAAYEANVERLGLDQPVIVQFFLFMGRLLIGDFGTSISMTNGAPVFDLVWPAAAKSIEICIITILFTLPLAIPLGRLAAKKEGEPADRKISVLSYFYYGLPLFFIALLFQYFFVGVSKIIPFATNYCSSEYEVTYLDNKITGFYLLDSLLKGNFPMFGDVLVHLILPCVTLSIIFGSLLIPVIRSNRLKELNIENEQYRDQTSVYLFNFGVLFMGLFVVESSFSLRGLTIIALTAMSAVDYNVSVGAIFVIFVIFLLSNFILNLIQIIRFKDIEEVDGESFEPTLLKGPQIGKDNDMEVYRSHGLSSHFKNPTTIIGLALFALLLIGSLLAPLFYPKVDIIGVNMMIPAYSPPSSEHLLGTTAFGRDVLGVSLYGIRTIILISVGISFIGFLIGAPIGFLSGHKEDKVGEFFMVYGNLVMVVPLLLLQMSVIYILGQTIYNEIIFLSIISAVIIGQLTRNLVLNFVASNGPITDKGILLKELLPKLIGLFFLHCIYIALLHSTLSFLGYNDPQIVDLGNAIALARSKLFVTPWAALWPGVALLLVCLSFSLMAHGFNIPSPSRVSRANQDQSTDVTFASFQVD